MPAPAPCPHCGLAMREVSARARNGYLILLDQCPQCGGIWCDRWELYPLADDAAAQLDAVDAASLYAAIPRPTAPGRCPRCTSALQPFRDPALPTDAHIERCPVCDGMWMNRGELARIKRRPSAAPAHADALAHLTTAYGAQAHWAKVANLDAATYAADGEDDTANVSEDLRSIFRSATPWLVLRALLRLLLRV